MITDHKSPIVYGYTGPDLPVYFSAEPVLSAGGAGAGIGPGGLRASTTVPGTGEDITPNSHPVKLSPFSVEGAGDEETPASTAPGATQVSEAAAMQSMMRQFGIVEDTAAAPRVIMRFPDKASDILLSGALGGGEAITHRALAIDAPLGKGHVVMFALRPFWRWQTQGTYSLGFNTILNWDHLDAGAPPPSSAPASARGRRGTGDEANTQQ
jgi:hypothetical protein